MQKYLIFLYITLVLSQNPWLPVQMHQLSHSSVQFSRSVVSDFATRWTTARQASLSITNSQSPLKLMFEKRWQEYTEELYKKDLHNSDNHEGVITHVEPDILQCEVKWALGSITMIKASEGDGIPVELLQILKDGAVKVLHSVCQQIWKTQQWPRDWERSRFHPNPKDRQFQRRFKLPHSWTHLTR